MKPIKTAVIGTGFIGPAHLEALQRIGGVQVVALASMKRKRLAPLESASPFPGSMTDGKTQWPTAMWR